MEFKERSYLHNRRVQGEAVCADVEAAATFPEDLVKIMNHSECRWNNADETALYKRKMPSRASITKEEKSMSGFQVLKDRLTLLLETDNSWWFLVEVNAHTPFKKS